MFKEKLRKWMKGLCPSGRLKMLSLMLLAGTTAALAQNAAGDYTAGTYAIAGVVAIVGAISVYIKMNNEEQDVKKSIMMIVGACIFLVAAAQALPLFFGITS